MSKTITRLRPLVSPTLERRRISAVGHPQHRILTAIAADGHIPTLSVKRDVGNGHESGTPLSLLPLPDLIRSYTITSLSSFPTILKPSLRLMSILAHSSSPFLNPDRNPLLRFLLKKTFYAQFCAGENSAEVKRTSDHLKSIGYKGVILAYGREIVLERGQKLDVSVADTKPSNLVQETRAQAEVRFWKEGSLKTVEMTQPGDFVAMKFSGAGQDVMRQLAEGMPPSKDIEAAIVEICEKAKERGVPLLFDAEQALVQKGIDAWTVEFQRRYNREKAVIYGTYQAYLRATPQVLAEHLATAQDEGFKLGVKLVRGAYMATDPRNLFWNTKEDTDIAYNQIAEALTTRSWNGIMKATRGQKEVPMTSLVLATHNMDSVKKCMTIHEQQTNGNGTDVAYAQLMGMSDDVSCELLMAGRQNTTPALGLGTPGPSSYKYCVWGSVGECLKYLVRRAEENRDAMGRANGTRIALGAELRRRLFG